MNGIVVFAYLAWSEAYPELAQYVAQPAAQGYFNMATVFCDNTASSPITDSSVGGQRETLLYMATAHIAKLLNKLDQAAPSQLVGRISNASQGSVSVATQNDYPPGSAQWWQQTQYGSMFWMATAQFRRFRYRAGTARSMDPFAPVVTNDNPLTSNQ